MTRWQREGEGWVCAEGGITPWIEGHERIYQAMVLGLRDSVNKNGFSGVVLGLSGGIDSGLPAVVAVDALGRARGDGVWVPSPSTGWRSEARRGGKGCVVTC